MSEHDKAARFDRLDSLIAEGRLIRNAWTRGHDRACLLAAISPEAGQEQSSSACPAWLLPTWFAQLVPVMDDSGTLQQWNAFVVRFARVVRQATKTLDDKAWQRVEYRIRLLALREAMSHTTDETALAACRTVAGLCEQAITGPMPESAAWSAAESAAWSAARSAAESAAWSAAWSAARSAAWSAAWSAARSAAESAAWSAARSAAESAAWSAAESAAWSAARSAAESAAWSAAESAAWSAARSAAWDRMNNGILDALELEITACQ